jgi:hypothetical protein
MSLRIDEAFIEKWHPRYDEIADDEREYQTLCRTVRENLSTTSTISKPTFLAIWRWKGALRVIGRTSIYAEGYKTQAAEPAQDEYDSRYAEAFRRTAAAPSDQKLPELIGSGVKLPGMGAPTASTIIHFIHPETMPIIDVRTVGSLYEARCISTRQCDLEHYEEFRKAIDKIRGECSRKWTLREVDRALFAYHKLGLDRNVDGNKRGCEI